MTTVSIYDDRRCFLGEGALWHPLRQQLFWFDIVNRRLLSRDADGPQQWDFTRMVSAAGWVDRDRLLIASESGLLLFDLQTGSQTLICSVEADQEDTRSNDGRADPWGGFWFGTMSKTGEPGCGSLYRWYRGELTVLVRAMSTPNSICFDRSRGYAYYTDTKTRLVLRQRLAPQDGAPFGSPELFLDLRATANAPEFRPDGAVVDQEGCLWIAQWGAARVARYSPEGGFLSEVRLPTGHSSCPAFGGADLRTLFVTTAEEKLPADHPEWVEHAGRVFACPTSVAGCKEPAVLLA